MPNKSKATISRIDEALAASRESRYVEFKTSFDPSNRRDLCEVLKDVLAFANSEGGVIVVGLDDSGEPTGSDVHPLLRTDPADLANKLTAYTGRHFEGLEVRGHKKAGKSIATLSIEPAPVPLVPIRPGTYEKEPGKQAVAFSVGVVYVRHGAKSEPATSNDLERIIERRLKELRAFWLGGVRKMITAPAGSILSVAPKGLQISDKSTALPVRVTNDPNAQVVGLADPDRTHPYRLHDLIPLVNEGLKALGIKINDYDVRAVLALFGADKDTSYTWKPQFGSRKYSETFAQWLVAQGKQDKRFFKRTRSTWRRARRLSGVG